MQTYERLLAQIEKIPIFDHHAHPGDFDDPGVDAMATSPMNPVLRLRANNPELVAAEKALFGYPFDDLEPEHVRWIVDKRTSLRRERGRAYFSDVLDRLNIERSVANRAFMADYLDPGRFVWVFFADSFMWPFDNQAERSRNPDQAVNIPLQEQMLRRFLGQERLSRLPSDFGDYLSFVSRTLEDNQRMGAVAMKFEVAYFRSTRFGDPTREEASQIYRRYVAGGIPTGQDYRTFQDYLFRYLVQEGGRLQLPVHIHSAVGIADYFNLAESNIMNLESVVRDPRYGSTTFVMIHGGYPYDREAIWMTALKNVYLDSSEIDLLLYPSEFKKVLKRWLEIFPEKITFGTDAFPYLETLHGGVEEAYWLGVQSSRTALAAALAEMVSAGEATEARALQMAHGYLHDNALGIYKGKVP
jgi:predicted TIM-barrel fold metal-dependent hydrolase